MFNHSYILKADTKLDEILKKVALHGANSLFCVIDGQKLVGVISKGDLTKHLDSHLQDSDSNSTTAYEIANKEFLKINIKNIESDVYYYLSNAKTKYIPLVDSEDNLITILELDSFSAHNAWTASQTYEFKFWSGDNRDLDNLIEKVQRFYRNKENYNTIWLPIDPTIEKNMLDHVKDKRVLEIGCGPLCGCLPYLWFASERIAIEPLMDKYVSLWSEAADDVKIDDMLAKRYSTGADVFIPELQGKIDGLIYTRNAIDHTPNWPFILSNISSYAVSGSYLYLWTVIHHAFKPDAGHYNITPSVDSFCRMIENFGFNILESKTNTPLERNDLYINMMAIKK